MLRGRCFCAISGRPGTPSGTQAPRPTPFSALRLLATSHSLARRSFSAGGPLATALVSPIIPVHTQKQGGRATKKLSASSAQPSANRKKVALSRLPRLATRLPRAVSARGHSLARRSFSAGGPLTSVIPAPVSTATLRVVPAPIFTTTSRIHVGAPTFLLPHPVKMSRGGLPPSYGGRAEGRALQRRRNAGTTCRALTGEEGYAGPNMCSFYYLGAAD